MNEEIAEQQAGITGLLLHHVHAPFVGSWFVRGVLPVPSPAEAVRIVTGPAEAHSPTELTAYEVGLRRGDTVVTVYEFPGILRALLAGNYSSIRAASSVMGMRLVHVEAVSPAAPHVDDNALRILRTLTSPVTGERSTTRLRGFLFTARDRLRLYFDVHDSPEVVAADVKTSGAVTALVTALPVLIRENERKSTDSSDPHCSSKMDLTAW